jgi:hypothetical protein
MLRRFFYVFVSLSTLHGYTALREYLEDVFWETGLSVYGILGNLGIFTLKIGLRLGACCCPGPRHYTAFSNTIKAGTTYDGRGPSFAPAPALFA